MDYSIGEKKKGNEGNGMDSFRLMILMDVKMSKDGSGYYIKAEDGKDLFQFLV